HKLNKREALSRQREMDKLERSIGGIKDMTSLPDALFVVDVGFEKIAVDEARKLGIPVIAIVDTNCSPEDIDVVVPGNDDAIRAIRIYSEMVADAVLDGRGSKGNFNAAADDEFVEVAEVEVAEAGVAEEAAQPAQDDTVAEAADAAADGATAKLGDVAATSAEDAPADEASADEGEARE